jgi:hypothetical protein
LADRITTAAAVPVSRLASVRPRRIGQPEEAVHVGPPERPHLRGDCGAARAARSLRPLPLGTCGARAGGTFCDRAGTDPTRRRRRARRRRRGCCRETRGRPLQALRYEVRRWRDGIIPDVAEAVESPHRLSENPDHARRLLELVPQVPTPAWGRDELGCEPIKLTDRLDAPDATPIIWRRPARRRLCFRCAAD